MIALLWPRGALNGQNAGIFNHYMAQKPKDNKHLRSSSVYKPYSLQKRGYGLDAIISDIFRMYF